MTDEAKSPAAEDGHEAPPREVCGFDLGSRHAVATRVDWGEGAGRVRQLVLGDSFERIPKTVTAPTLRVEELAAWRTQTIQKILSVAAKGTDIERNGAVSGLWSPRTVVGHERVETKVLRKEGGMPDYMTREGYYCVPHLSNALVGLCIVPQPLGSPIAEAVAFCLPRQALMEQLPALMGIQRVLPFKRLRVCLEPVALMNLLRRGHDGTPAAADMVVHVGEKKTLLCAYAPHQRFMALALRVGLYNFRDDLNAQLGLQHVLRLDEYLRTRKEGFDCLPSACGLVERVAAAAVQFAQRLDGNGADGGARFRVFVSGAGAEVAALPDLLAERLRIPVRLMNPFEYLGLPLDGVEATWPSRRPEAQALTPEVLAQSTLAIALSLSGSAHATYGLDLCDYVGEPPQWQEIPMDSAGPFGWMLAGGGLRVAATDQSKSDSKIIPLEMGKAGKGAQMPSKTSRAKGSSRKPSSSGADPERKPVAAVLGLLLIGAGVLAYLTLFYPGLKREKNKAADDLAASRKLVEEFYKEVEKRETARASMAIRDWGTRVEKIIKSWDDQGGGRDGLWLINISYEPDTTPAVSSASSTEAPKEVALCFPLPADWVTTVQADDSDKRKREKELNKSVAEQVAKWEAQYVTAKAEASTPGKSFRGIDPSQKGYLWIKGQSRSNEGDVAATGDPHQAMDRILGLQDYLKSECAFDPDRDRASAGRLDSKSLRAAIRMRDFTLAGRPVQQARGLEYEICGETRLRVPVDFLSRLDAAEREGSPAMAWRVPVALKNLPLRSWESPRMWLFELDTKGFVKAIYDPEGGVFMLKDGIDYALLVSAPEAHPAGTPRSMFSWVDARTLRDLLASPNAGSK